MPGEQALNKCICIDDLCMLADERPELSMPCCELCILRPLLLLGNRVPVRVSLVRLQHEQRNQQTILTQGNCCPITCL